MSADKQPPSATKLRQLRKKGTLPTSAFATAAIATGVFAASVQAQLPRWGEALGALWRAASQGDAANATLATRSLVTHLLLAMLLASLVALFVQLVQSRGYAAPPKPGFARLKPFASYRSRFSADARWTALSQIIALTPPLIVAVQVSRGLRGRFERAWLIDAPLDERAASLLPALGATLAKLLLTFMLSLAAAAAFDLWMRRRGFMKKHGMDVHEQKQEYKSQEGAPEKKQAQAEARFMIMMGPPARAMRAADVVIRNPTHIAVAISGAFTDDPWILMVGRGRSAKHMRRLARRYGRPQVRSVPLARALAAAGEGADVPADLIAAVTEAAYWAHGLAPDEPPEG